MRLAELRTTDGRTLVLHPRHAIVEADETTRSSVLAALSGALSGGSPAAGLVEVHGIVLDLDRASFVLLEVDPQLPLVLGSDDIPAEAFGPSDAPRRAAEDVATTQRELVDARKQQAQGALEVVTAVHAALRAATIERDEAKARLDEAEHEFDAAIASAKRPSARSTPSPTRTTRRSSRQKTLQPKTTLQSSRRWRSRPSTSRPKTRSKTWATPGRRSPRLGPKTSPPPMTAWSPPGAKSSSRLAPEPGPAQRGRQSSARGRPRGDARGRRPRQQALRRQRRAPSTRRSEVSRAGGARSARPRLVFRLLAAVVDGGNRSERRAETRDRTDRARGSRGSVVGRSVSGRSRARAAPAASRRRESKASDCGGHSRSRTRAACGEAACRTVGRRSRPSRGSPAREGRRCRRREHRGPLATPLT